VDDYEELRKEVCALLAGEPRFSVIGEDSDGVKAISQARKLKPDVIVLGLNMPVLGGMKLPKKSSCLRRNLTSYF